MGKVYLLQRQIENLEININLLTLNPSVEAVRLVKEKKDVCLTIIAYHTCKEKKELFSKQTITMRKNLFAKELSDEELATLMIMVLTSDKTKQFIKYFGIDKEQERMRKVMAVKETKNNISFGGKSMYGAMIDAACERYGWSLDYVMWGISFTNLKMLLADKPSSIYVSDDELKKLPASVFVTSGSIKADGMEGREQIRNTDWR